jgi:flagellar hook-associated protein FlgK
MSADVDARLPVEASEITGLARGVARLNDDIAVAIQQTGQPPNDLLDHSAISSSTSCPPRWA